MTREIEGLRLPMLCLHMSALLFPPFPIEINCCSALEVPHERH
jgi:hypothetical protein